MSTGTLDLSICGRRVPSVTMTAPYHPSSNPPPKRSEPEKWTMPMQASKDWLSLFSGSGIPLFCSLEKFKIQIDVDLEVYGLH